jgi:tetratricopeptide (TPR) repeat protein
LRKGDPEGVTNAAEAIISARPSSADGYVLRAVAEDFKRDPTGAEADLNKAMEVAPRNPSGFTAMAQLRTSQKRYADAEKYYRQALSIDPNSTQALRGLVALFVGEKQLDKAIAEVSDMIAKAPENSAYYTLEATFLLGRKPPEFNKAETDLLKASDLNKSDATPLLLLAEVYTSQGAADKAESSVQDAIQHNPKDPRAYFLSAAIEERQGNWQKAQELYQRTLQVQPDFPLASNNVAYLMLEHGGNSDVALTFAQTARQKLPDNPSVADTLAWAYYKKGIYNLSIGLLEEAIKKAPDNASFHYHLGLAYQKADEKSKAKAHLERTLQLSPTFDHAADVKAALAELHSA